MPKRKKSGMDLAMQQRVIFAKNFKKYRLEANMTQQQVEKITGFDQAFISNVENSKKPCSLDIAHILADSIGKQLWQLLVP